MKSKMKTTFALIAVALMVMVAVVPMIGIFTDNTAAEIDPIDDPLPTTDGIVINAKVMDAAGIAVNGVFVLVTYGDKAQFSVTSAATAEGKVTVNVKDDVASNATATVVDGDGMPVVGFSPKSLGNLTGGETYVVNFVKGEKTKAITFNAIQTGASAFTTLPAILGSTDVVVTYSLYSDNSYNKSKKIDGGSVELTGAVANIPYNASVTSAFLKIEGFTYAINEEVYNLGMVIEAGDMLADGFKAERLIVDNYNFLTLTLDNIIELGSIDTAISNAKDNAATPVDIPSTAFVEVTSKTIKNGTSAYYYYPISEDYGKVKTLTVTLSFGKDAKIDISDATVTVSGYNNTTAQIKAANYNSGAFYGTFKMGTVGAYTGQSLEINLATVEEEEYVDGEPLGVYVYNGNYIATGADAGSYLKVVADGFALVSIGTSAGKAIDEDGYTEGVIPLGSNALVVNDDDYELVNYDIVMVDDEDNTKTEAITEDVELTISGVSSAFGYEVKDNTVTLTSNKGAYSIMIKSMDAIEFSSEDVEFKSGETGPWIVGVTEPDYGEIVIAPAKVYFKFVDGNGTAIKQNVNIAFPETSSLYGLYDGNAVVAVYNDTTKMNSFDLYASYIDPTGAEFTAAQGTHIFEAEYLYFVDSGADYMTVDSLDTKYYLYLEDVDDSIVVKNVSLFNYYHAKACINEAGVLDIVAVDANVTPVPVSDNTGKITLTLNSAYVGNEIENYSETTDVYIIVPNATNTADYNLKKYYVFEPTSGTMIINALVDSLKGKVVRNDGTPISGALVQLKDGEGKVLDADVSADSTGAFTVLSPVKFSTAGLKIFISYGTYDFDDDGYAVWDGGKKAKITTYKPLNDAYLITVEDANESAFLPVSTDVMTFSGSNSIVTVPGIGFAMTGKFSVGQNVAVTLTGRTIANHTMTAAELSTGVIELTTGQVPYVISFMDMDDEYIQCTDAMLAALKFYNCTESGEFVDITATGMYDKVRFGYNYYVSFALDVPSSAYIGQAVGLTIDGDAMTYAFHGSKFILDDEKITAVVSTSKDVVVPAVDYFGNKFVINPAAGPAYPKLGEGDGVAVELTIDGALKFKYDTTVESYALNWNGCTVTYLLDVTDHKATIAGPVTLGSALYSTSGLYEISVGDSFGMPLDDTAVTLIGYTGVGDTGTVIGNIVLDDGEGSIFAIGGSYAFYEIVAPVYALLNYTFDASETLVFLANECEIDLNFLYANDLPIDMEDVEAIDLAAFDEDGNIIGTTIGTSIVVDVSEVVAISGIVTDGEGDEYPFMGTSADLYCTYSKITGPLPTTPGAGAHVYVELWKDGVVVDGADADIEGNKYTAVIDISGAIEGTAGVAFDTVTATYFDGAATYTSVVNPTSSYNPIVITPVIQYDVTLTSSAAALAHVAKVVSGNTAYLSADIMFENVVDTNMVEGKQVVEKYTFAGWYVNGVAVNSKEANVSVELTQPINSAYAKYNVEIYEVVSPTPEPTPAPAVDNSIDPTVLVIGICAVIVALIAVAYAVISSRPKEKKE